MIVLSTKTFAGIIVGTVAGTLFLTCLAIFIAFKCTWRDGMFTGPYGSWELEGEESVVESRGGSGSGEEESEVEDISGVIPGGIGGGEEAGGKEAGGEEVGGVEEGGVEKI